MFVARIVVSQFLRPILSILPGYAPSVRALRFSNSRRAANGFTRPYPSVRLRIDFRDPDIVGTFPFHCHILQHEDGGMMGSIRVEPLQWNSRKKRKIPDPPQQTKAVGMVRVYVREDRQRLST